MNTLKKFARHYPIWLLSGILAVMITLYWTWLATPRYVSEAHIVLQTADVAPPQLSFANMLTGASANNVGDLKLLSDYLQSLDVIELLETQFQLRAHYSQPEIDYISRLTQRNWPIERFQRFFQKRVSVELDEFTGILIVTVEAHSADLAKAVADRLLELGEKHINDMGQKLASGQVEFIQKQVDVLRENLLQAQQSLLDYQNQHNLVSPTATIENFSAIVASLNTQLSQLQAQKSLLLQYQSDKSVDLININAQIAAVKKQIAVENSKLTKVNGDALNKLSIDYKSLELQAQFAQELYSNALATLEATRIEASRKLKQVAVTQSANLAGFAMEPSRLYNIVVDLLILLVITVILSMLYEVIRDHRD